MGAKIKQKILTCDECKRIPEDDEVMWEMCGLTICSNCIDKTDDEKKADW